MVEILAKEGKQLLLLLKHLFTLEPLIFLQNVADVVLLESLDDFRVFVGVIVEPLDVICSLACIIICGHGVHQCLKFFLIEF